MAIPAVTEAQVRKTIATLCKADKYPELSADEMDVLVRQSFAADSRLRAPVYALERASSKEYAVGDVIVPLDRNGHIYACTLAGVSGSAEPEFPGVADEVIEDGGCEWQEVDTADWDPTYDPTSVIGNGWEMKAGNAAGDYGFTTDGQTFNRQQVYDMCMKQAASWKRRKNASVPLPSPTSKRRTTYIPDAFSAQMPEDRLDDLVETGWSPR